MSECVRQCGRAAELFGPFLSHSLDVKVQKVHSEKTSPHLMDEELQTLMKPLRTSLGRDTTDCLNAIKTGMGLMWF